MLGYIVLVIAGFAFGYILPGWPAFLPVVIPFLLFIGTGFNEGFDGGLLVRFLIALVVVILSLEQTVVSLRLLVSIAFFLAIAFFLFLIWRERRSEIAMWPRRSRTVLYGAVGLALVDIGAAVLLPWPSGGLEALVFFFVLGACVFAAWRVWRDEHTYGY
jgi:hypothetical protein